VPFKEAADGKGWIAAMLDSGGAAVQADRSEKPIARHRQNLLDLIEGLLRI
jgi:hypothetical protein